jgi:hypothetical protein
VHTHTHTHTHTKTIVNIERNETRAKIPDGNKDLDLYISIGTSKYFPA